MPFKRKLVVKFKNGETTVYDDVSEAFEMDVEAMANVPKNRQIVSWTFFCNETEVVTIYRFS